MQTAALVYRPPMPSQEESARYGGDRFNVAPPRSLRVLVAGRFDLPVQDVADRFARVISRAVAPDFQTVLNLLGDLPFVDLVMLDASLPGLEGVAELRKLCELANGIPVIVVCNGGEEKKAVELLRNGAAGVIPGSMSGDAVAGAIQLVLSGQRFAPAELLMDPAGSETRDGSVIETLSAREKEVAEFIAQGCPNKEIACRLGLQEITIKVYASAIFRKLGVRNRTAAAARLLAEGI